MFKKITILVLFVVSQHCVRAQINDNFNDGDFSLGTAWTEGTPGTFKDTLGMLRSNSTTASSSFYISTPNALANNCQWEFFVNLKFSTSSLNSVDVYLTADNSDLSSATLNGYFVRIGNTTDEISLYINVGGTVTEIIDGIDGIISSSTNNLIKVKVTRTSANLFTLERDMSGTGSSYTTEGSITDATFTSSSFFGFLVRQSTSSFFKKHFFDDVVVGAIATDTSPPTLVSASPLSATTVDVLFNEPLETTSAQTLANYTVNGGIGNPSTAVQDGGNPALIHLSFATAFTNSTTYELVVDNVSDVLLNAMDNDTISFFYFEPDTAVLRDVVINEFMADETPSVGLPAAEFVELYNRSGKYFDLAGWTISDGSSTATLGTIVLAPGEYLILCPTAAVASYSAFGTTLGVSSFPSLNNSGDAIILKDNFGTTIDNINYTLSWYHDPVKDDGGYSIEQINPDANCISEFNWSASNNVSGGTPGAQNSIFSTVPDTISPQMISYVIASSAQITVTLDEPVDTSASSGFVFTVVGLTVSSFTVVTPGLDQVIINFTTNIDTGTLYTLVATNLVDCEGNGIGESDSLDFILPFPAAYRDVVINELLADESPQVGLPAAEFIELYNVSTKSIDLNGWTVSDGSATATLTSKILNPGQYIIICPNADTSDYKLFGTTMGVSTFPSLNNTGDNLVLKDNAGTVIDAVNYTDNWYGDASKDDGGYSLEQINPFASCLNAGNWHASNDANGGTPGTQNSVYDTTADVTAPQLISHEVNSNTQVTLYYSEAIDTSNTAAFVFSMTGGIPVSSFMVTGSDLTQIVVVFGTPIDTGITYTLTASNISDCEANGVGVNNSVNFMLGWQAVANELIINEVLFNPTTGVSDFVEIYNNSSNTINLKNWNLANIENDTIDNHKLISGVDLLINPGEYYAFTTDKAALVGYYTQAMVDRVVEIPSLPSYDNDSGTVVLISNKNHVSDRFSYTEDMQFALLNSVDGVSLERTDFNRPANDAGNWHSAAEEVGFATPGYENSQYNPLEAGTDELNLSTEIFSPDNDGYQDQINFSYVFTETGYVGNATLYDARGREIKKLLRNELLATDGVFTWDGLNEKNEKAAIGIYVIYFEYFNLSGTVKKIKKSFVLAGKLNE